MSNPVAEEVKQLLATIEIHRAGLKLAEKALVEYRQTCQHQLEEWSDAHRSGYVCVKCLVKNVVAGSICYQVTDCKCSPMPLPSQVEQSDSVYFRGPRSFK